MSASASPEPQEVAPPPQHAQGTQALMDGIFGGEGSDLSDSESEGEGPAVPKRKAFPPRRDAPAGDDDDDEDHRPAASDDDDDDDEEAGDAYVPGTVNSAAKIPKFKKRPAGDVDGDEDEEGEERVKERRKKKKSKRAEKKRRDEGDGQEEDEDSPMVDEATQKRLALEARIDNIGKKGKTTRKKKDNEDAVDTYHDDICIRLRERMMNAVDKDRQSNENQLPATAKLAMLDEVMGILRNSTLWTQVVDNGVLEAVRAWLEPMETTAALPAVGIQSALFEVLPKMELDTATLKETRLGPIVLFYTKTKRVTPAISRAADALVQTWSRPIVKRPGDNRRHADEGEGAARDSQSQSQSQSQGGGAVGAAQRRRRFDAATAIKENHGRKGARMPQVKETQYTVTPAMRTVHQEEDTAQVRKIASDNKKFNKFARQMRLNKR